LAALNPKVLNLANIEELMLDIMYTLPSEENVKEFTITKKMVDNLFSSKIVKLPSGSKRVIKESA